MGYNKIKNLLGINTDAYPEPKYSTKKWIEIFDQSSGTYNKNKDIRFETNQLRNDLYDFNDAYIAVTGKITTTNANTPANVIYNRRVALKNTPAPFFNCILKFNNQLIGDAQDLDIVMPIYNLLYYSKNLRKITGSCWNYYPDMVNSGYSLRLATQTVARYQRERVFYPIKDSESFDYKTNLVGILSNGNNPELESIKIVVPLKNLGNFMFNLDFLMINAEIELTLKWSEDCALIEKITERTLPAGDDAANEPAVLLLNKPENLALQTVNYMFLWLLYKQNIKTNSKNI